MTRRAFIRQFEKAAHVNLIGGQTGRVIALAKKHRASVLIADVETCRGENMSFTEWLSKAETHFPVAATILYEGSADLFTRGIMNRLKELDNEKRQLPK